MTNSAPLLIYALCFSWSKDLFRSIHADNVSGREIHQPYPSTKGLNTKRRKTVLNLWTLRDPFKADSLALHPRYLFIERLNASLLQLKENLFVRPLSVQMSTNYVNLHDRLLYAYIHFAVLIENSNFPATKQQQRSTTGTGSDVCKHCRYRLLEREYIYRKRNATIMLKLYKSLS